jgi:DNA repair protein RadA/Sms
MARDSSVYRCQQCGFASPKPGTCPDCRRATGGLVPLVEERGRATHGGRPSASSLSRPIALKEIASESGDRLVTRIVELDRVLGGGVVKDSLVLIGGEPGAGKSTLLLQAARALTEVSPPVLYVSAEESAAQVKIRADRLGVGGDGLLLWAENDLSLIVSALDEIRPRALIVDSIQTVYLPELESAPGSVAQVRECGGRLLSVAKGQGLATFIVGHVTKEGALAGPRVLEHLVDTVLYFEGERHDAYRVLRAVKNRFGSTNEIGVFQMSEDGLAEVRNPSGFFLAERPKDAPGSVIVSSLEGTRPLLLELQALVAPASFGTPRRTVLGADYNRVCLLLAVLEKRAGVPLGNQDVFVNVAGGGRVTEPAADLGIVLAAASSYMERPLRGDVLVLGEVGLTGEVRAVTGIETRLREGAALGFQRAVVPASNLTDRPMLSLEVEGVATIADALELLLR